jgi:hypothetical protein
MAALLLCACAEVEQGDANRVSIVAGEYTPQARIFITAQNHCAKYGKSAVLLVRYTKDTTIYRCQ